MEASRPCAGRQTRAPLTLRSAWASASPSCLASIGRVALVGVCAGVWLVSDCGQVRSRGCQCPRGAVDGSTDAPHRVAVAGGSLPRRLPGVRGHGTAPSPLVAWRARRDQQSREFLRTRVIGRRIIIDRVTNVSHIDERPRERSRNDSKNWRVAGKCAGGERRAGNRGGGRQR
jgi:hypothetical protein